MRALSLPFRYLLLSCCFFAGLAKVGAQPLPCPPSTTSSVYAGNDTTVCRGGCVTLNADINSTLTSTSAYTVTSPAYQPSPYNQGTPVLVNIDDTWTTPITLAFPFCFFGTKYTAVQIGSNGQISFDLTHCTGGGCNAYSVFNPIPNNYSSYNNCIMAPFYDMDPTVKGKISYNTYGIFPCRTFVVSWNGLGTYPCLAPGNAGCPYVGTQQIVLYESTYAIDINVHQKQFFTGSTSSGNAVLGIQDGTATQAYSPTGLNNTQFDLTDTTFRFTPSGAPMVYYQWLDSATGTVVSTSANPVVCPDSSTTYQLQAILTSQCDSVFLNDFVRVNTTDGLTITGTATNPSTCGGHDGYITIDSVKPGVQYTVNYTYNGTPVTLTNETANPDSTIKIANLDTGTYNTINVKANMGCTSNDIGPFVLTMPTLTAGFSDSIIYGCAADTVLFTNLSATAGPMTYTWTYGDGNADTITNPTHVYVVHNLYNVQLVATNGVCYDSVTHPLDLNHPLAASFNVSADTICQNGSVVFQNTSVATSFNGVNPTYFWIFGDGSTDTSINPTHQYTQPGVYDVQLIARNFVPCVDTAHMLVTVDSLPFLSFTISDSILCAGKNVYFNGSIATNGLLGYQWSYGDGNVLDNTNPTQHGYDVTGPVTISLTAHYAVCPDTTFTRKLTIHNFPNINIGPDTTMCPNGDPIPLHDLYNAGNPNAHYVWSTGETTPAILAHTPDTYTATVTVDGCSASDEMTIFKDCYLDIPNAFTPNGDGLNDYFFPRQLLSRSVTAFTMQVFNRWGELIFTTSAIDGRGWDGKFNDIDQPKEVYVYVINVAFGDGRSEHYKGNVTLIR